MKAVVFTLGCKVNECESDSIISALIDKGYEVSDKLEVADLYIVNTCAVTKEAEKKSRQTASRILKLNPNAKIIYTGCASQKYPEQFANKPNVSLITGTFSKGEIVNDLNKKGINISPESKEFEELNMVKTLRTRTYVKVQDGCDNFCSYCIIPYLRGRNRARSPVNIIAEIEATKPLETVLNGINLSAYCHNGVDLTQLMVQLKDVNTRIRLGSLEVGVINDEFLSALKSLKDFACHFHLSLQSGSDKVLKKMNRRYTREEYISACDLIRKYFPNAGITTDIIVGFPYETEEDFNQTIDLVNRVQFSDIHPFIFSKREGTVAYNMPDVSDEDKKLRLDKLMKIKQNLKDEFAKSQKGKTLKMLPEIFKDGYTIGYSENYLRLYVKGNHLDRQQIVNVVVGEPYGDGAIATIK